MKVAPESHVGAAVCACWKQTELVLNVINYVDSEQTDRAARQVLTTPPASDSEQRITSDRREN